ncbi:hypothetical protein [Streptomyces violascens]|uniref:hypothetical protein n=1 Tax=Streptomyces violascens TaxID=67381 RepID=UPI0036B13B37
MTSDNRAVGAAKLKALRHSRGLSLAECARALLAQASSIGHPSRAAPTVAGLQRSVARWESIASPTLPDERHQLLLAHLYARTPGDEIVLGPGSDFAEFLNALTYLGASQAWLASLRSTVVRAHTSNGGGLIALLPPEISSMLTSALVRPEWVDERLSAALQSAVTDIGAQFDTLPFARLQLLLAPVVEASRRLLAAPIPEPVQSSLRAVAVSAYTLAGRVAFELRDDVASQALYTEATHEAGLLAVPWRRATVHLSHAMASLHSAAGMSKALQLADAAVRDANRGRGTAVRPWAHAWQAALTARAGDHQIAQNALELAAYDMDSASSGSRSGDDFSPWHLHGFTGVCQLYAGCADTAHDTLSQALQSMAMPLAEQAILITSQALARVRLGDPEAGAALLHHCLEACPAHARIPTVRLNWARKELRPWQHEQFVTALDDHLMEAVAPGP